MHFPQELIEEIISYLSFHDKEDQRSLRNCSLVAKSWIYPSRKRIFESITITGANRQSWLDRISPSNTELLQHVRTFHLSICVPLERTIHGHPEIEDIYVYFPSFHRLHTINLTDTRIFYDTPEEVQMLSSCQQTLTSLALCSVSFRWRTFIALIDYFPNLRYLETDCLAFEDTSNNPPPLSRPLRGTLRFCYGEKKDLAALSNWFTGLEVEYEELMIEVNYFTGECSQRVVDTCAKTLKRLRFELSECIMPQTVLRTLANPSSKWVSL